MKRGEVETEDEEDCSRVGGILVAEWGHSLRIVEMFIRAQGKKT